MSDNFPITPGTGRNAATDQVTHSGDTADVQLMRPVLVTGSEGSKTVVDLTGDATNGLDVDVTRVKPDGTNTMPSLDAVGRAGFLKLTDGTLIVGIIDETGGSAVDAAAVGGGTPHDSVDSGNPIKLGGYAKAAAPTDVSADGDRVNGWFLRNGALVVNIAAGGTLWTNQGQAAASAQFSKITDGTLSAGVIDETGASAVDAVAVGGGTAHDAVNSGNPLYLGGEAIAHGTNPTAVAAADRTKWYFNRAGVPFVMGGHPNVITIEYATTGSQTDVAIVTISTGLKIVVTQIQLISDNANTAFPSVRVGFGTANTPTTTGVVLTHPGAPAGGGVSRGDGSGILGIGADNEDLRITCGAPTGGSLRILVSYYTIET